MSFQFVYGFIKVVGTSISVISKSPRTFKVVQNNTTKSYKVTFDIPLDNTPQVFLKQVYALDTITGVGGSTLDNGVVLSCDNKGFGAVFGDAAGKAAFRHFSFLAISKATITRGDPLPYILAASIDPAGAIRVNYSNSKVTCKRVATGLYEVEMADSKLQFPSLPTVLAVQNRRKEYVGDTRDGAIVACIATNGKKIRFATGDALGNKSDRHFNIVIVGTLASNTQIAVPERQIRTGAAFFHKLNVEKTSDFSLQMNDDGRGSMIFSRPFSGVEPIVLCQQQFGSENSVGDTRDNSLIYEQQVTQVEIIVGDSEGATTARTVHMIAIA